MLVGAGQKEHILAIETLKARQRVGRDRFISVTDMRQAVRISDRSRDVEGDCDRRFETRGAFLDFGFFVTDDRCFRALFATVVLADFFVFLAAFLRRRRFLRVVVLAFFAGALRRFFAGFFVARTREEARTCFAFRFLTVFLLGVATTNSLMAQTRLSGSIIWRSA